MKEDTRRIVAERLRKVRTQNNWTQKQVAEWSGIGAGHIAHYETGRRAPSAENLAALAKGLRTSADYLLGLVD